MVTILPLELQGNHILSQNNESIRVRKISLECGGVRYLPLRLFWSQHLKRTRQNIPRFCKNYVIPLVLKKTLNKKLGTEWEKRSKKRHGSSRFLQNLLWPWLWESISQLFKILYQSNCNDKIEKRLKFKIVMSGISLFFSMVRNLSRESKIIILFVSDRKSLIF